MDKLKIKKQFGFDMAYTAQKYRDLLGKDESLKAFLEYVIILTFNYFDNEKEAQEFLIKNSIEPIQFVKNQRRKKNEQ